MILIKPMMTSSQPASFLEDLIDACVMECYFREHMAERDLLFRDTLATHLAAYAPETSEAQQRDFSSPISTRPSTPPATRSTTASSSSPSTAPISSPSFRKRDQVERMLQIDKKHAVTTFIGVTHLDFSKRSCSLARR